MSHLRNTLVLTALALSTACAGDGATGPAANVSSLAARTTDAAASRPAGGRCVTTVTVVGGNATSIALAISGTCNLEHLGRTTMVAVQTVSLVDGAIVNSTTYTAANGDKLSSSFVGQVVSPPGPDVTFTGTETYNGGTGRFEGASGSSTLDGTATLGGPVGTGEYTTKGAIKY